MENKIQELKAETQIGGELRTLENRLLHLTERITELQDKLVTVCIPELAPSGEEATEAEDGLLAPMAVQLKSANDSIEYSYNRLLDIIKRIEI